MNKYLVDRIPYPFKTREQYEKSLQTPLGKDWNTQTAFQKLTMPRVTTKMGSVIAPLLPP
jgi:U3 small nucleolar RNA-associated protein 14